MITCRSWIHRPSTSPPRSSSSAMVSRTRPAASMNMKAWMFATALCFFSEENQTAMHAAVTQADKERVAREKGAVAFLTVSGPILSAYEARKGLGGKPLALYSQSDGERPLPGAWISAEFAHAVFPSHLMRNGRSLQEIQDQLNHLAPQSMPTTVSVHLEWNSTANAGHVAQCPRASSRTRSCARRRHHHHRSTPRPFRTAGRLALSRRR